MLQIGLNFVLLIGVVIYACWHQDWAKNADEEHFDQIENNLKNHINNTSSQNLFNPDLTAQNNTKGDSILEPFLGRGAGDAALLEGASGIDLRFGRLINFG